MPRSTQQRNSSNPNSSRASFQHSIKRHKQSVQKRLGSRYGDCRLCLKDHPLRSCYKFRKMTVSQRYEVIRKHHYCENCFALSHRLSQCRSSERCRDCTQRHHTMLHEFEEAIEVSPPAIHSSVDLRRVIILRPTAVVSVKTHNDWITVRAMVNPCEPTCLIAPWIVSKYDLEVDHFGGDSICSFTIKSHAKNNYTLKVKARIAKSLPYTIPSDDIDEKVATTFSNLILADPVFYKKAKVNMILGAEVYQKILQPGLIPGNVGSPVVQNTSLGWILVGSFGV